MLTGLKSLTGKDADADKDFENEQDAVDSDGSEIGDVEEQPSLDMTSLQAIGEYFVTSRAFSQYKQRLHQFLHPDHGDRDESVEVQSSNPGQEEYVMDATRGGEPGAKNLTDTSIEDSLAAQKEGTRDQPEARLNEHRADEMRIASRHKDHYGSLDGSSQIEDRPMLLKRDSLATWASKWVTDTLWPPSKGTKRIWYFCVSISLWS